MQIVPMVTKTRIKLRVDTVTNPDASQEECYGQGSAIVTVAQLPLLRS